MPRWATLIEIAGVSFTGCRAEIQDGQAFSSIYRGSNEYTNSGDVDTQHVNVGVKGNAFGITMLSNEIVKIKEMLEAVQAAQASGSSFIVHVTDEMYDINVHVVPDYRTGRWFNHGQPSEGYVANVTMRFISRAQVV